MLTGHKPFRGDTQTDVLVSILDKEPPPLAHYAADAPTELKRIVTKSLAKNRDERYQVVKDMALDLKSLKQRLEFEAELERTTATDKPRARTRDDSAMLESATRRIPAAQKPSQSSSIATSKSKNRALILALIAAALLGIGLIGARVWRSASARQTSAPAMTTAPPVTATADGRVLNYSITVQKYRNEKPYQKPFELSGEMIFEKDYRVRLNVGSTQSGYLYILNEGPGTNTRPPSFNILFPSMTANDGSALVAANRQIQIPAQSWFQFDAAEGTELIWLVWATESQPVLETVKGLANPRDKGAISDPAQAQAVEEFLKTHAATEIVVEKGDVKKQTQLTAKADILAYRVKLEHH
jgi:serine/threonine protein kinase